MANSSKHNRPRIDYLIPRLGISDRGAEVFIYELTKRLIYNFDVTVWVRYKAEKSILISNLEKKGVLVRRVKSISADHWLANIFYSFNFLHSFLHTLHLTPFEIEMLMFSFACFPRLLASRSKILFPANGFWGAFLCLLIRWLRGTPFVYATLGGIEPLIARLKPNLLVAINPGIKSWFEKNHPNLHVVYISTGVDLKRFSIKGKKADIHLPRPIFITVSALVPWKRVDLTIKAVGGLKNGSLIIIGEGPLEFKLRLQAQKYLGSGRFLFQRACYHDLPKFYRSADAFAFSAPWEVGWSMVHLEALASGLPVVANKETNIEFLLGEDKLLCNVGNVAEYSKYLKAATRVARGRQWRNKVVNYSWEKVARLYEDEFLKLLN